MIRRLKTLFVVLLTMWMTSLVAGTAFAGAATESVKKTQNDFFAALKAGDDKKVDTLFAHFIDYDTFAQDSLGSEWAGRSAAERSQFSDSLKKLVGQAYKCNLKKIVDYNIAYTSESPAGSAAWVKSTASKGSDSVRAQLQGGKPRQHLEAPGHRDRGREPRDQQPQPVRENHQEQRLPRPHRQDEGQGRRRLSIKWCLGPQPQTRSADGSRGVRLRGFAATERARRSGLD